MSVILILLAASLSIAVAFLAAFIWSVKSGQYEDDYTPSVNMLFDDHIPDHEQVSDDNSDKKNKQPEIN